MPNMRRSADIPSEWTDAKYNSAATCVANTKITRASHERNPRRWVNELRRRSAASKDRTIQAEPQTAQYCAI
eukprot:10283249-Heterocapsa_arctica.AAC.1